MLANAPPVALRAAPWSAGAALPLRFAVHPPGDPAREAVQAAIRQRYQERYGATIRVWLGGLASVHLGDELVAAAGFRAASTPLFLERYLSAPVEQYLDCPQGPVSRERIVEVGQFAALRAGAGRLLVPAMARHLHDAGYLWAVGTLTRELHHLFARMGLASRRLAAASPHALSEEERRDWGSYYTHAPYVMAGCLQGVVDGLERQS